MTEIDWSEVLLRAFAMLGASVALGYAAAWYDGIRLRAAVLTCLFAGCLMWSLDGLIIAVQLEAYYGGFGLKFFLWTALFLCLVTAVPRILVSLWERLKNPEGLVIFVLFGFFVLVVWAILTYQAPA